MARKPTAEPDLNPAVSDPTVIDPVQTGEGETLTIKGPARGRWRAGRHFTPEAVIIRARDLTPAQFEALMDDPELIVGIS